MALVLGALALGAPAGHHGGDGGDSSSNHHNGAHKDGDSSHVHHKKHHTHKHKGDGTSSGIVMCEGETCWPRYYLLGAQKAGTTSVFQMLHDADLICGATANDEQTYKYKEAHFFDLNYKKDKTAYASLYQKTENCDGTNFMDATPNYLFDHDVPTRMAEMFNLMPSTLIPHMRMMAILREPISRDLSIYNMFKSQWMAEKVKTDQIDAGSVLRSLCKDGSTGFPTYHEAVACMADEWHSSCKTTGVDDMDAYDKCAYDKTNLAGGRRNRLTDGMYAAQIVRHGRGMPRSHLLVLQFEQMLSNQPLYISKMISFLGLPSSPQLTEIPQDNTQAFPGKVETIRCDTLKSLHSVFTPWNKLLYKQIEDDQAAKNVPDEEPKFAQFVAPTCSTQEEVNDGKKQGEHADDGSAAHTKAAKPASLTPA